MERKSLCVTSGMVVVKPWCRRFAATLTVSCSQTLAKATGKTGAAVAEKGQALQAEKRADLVLTSLWLRLGRVQELQPSILPILATFSLLKKLAGIRPLTSRFVALGPKADRRLGCGAMCLGSGRLKH
ncbi:hypothetical protein SASPL_156764 [Salvia splendens]|uniref:Uncharacterized protein n=1 Tax=Salvia splendens TaxID=180675 RepID=A0A8X8YXF5_SALSN|nr:hypothetical protein SASPL_156764 [Salvia splendens]